MLNNCHYVQISGGAFTHYNGPPKRSGLERLHDAASPSAFDNSAERFDPPKCYPNTRTAILADIMDWIVGRIGWDRYIMWLYGPAGAGKSAIAQTIAELCRAKGILLASFFFSRSNPTRNNVRPLAASLAYQVAVNVPEARSHIESVVENDPALLYYFDQFGRHASQGLWFWPKSVAGRASQAFWPAWKSKKSLRNGARGASAPRSGRNSGSVTGSLTPGRCKNFVQLVTGHTPGRIDRNSTVFEQSFQAQFNALIVDPLMHIHRPGILSTAIPYVIIIDGLDECADANVQRHILKTAAALSSDKNFIPLMFMFSCRAEQEIRLTFSTSAFEGVTTRIALDDTYRSRADIRKYLEGSFSEMKKTHLHKELIPATWPEANDISLLVNRSSGQFIYAATVTRYISTSRYTPMNSLEIILGLRPARGGAPFAELDALYRDVLSRVKETSATLQLLGAGIYLKDGNRRFILERFLFLDKGDVARLLVDVSSLVAIDSNHIRFLHASFGDFLSDPDRSKEYYINPATTCTELVFIGLRHVERYNVGLDALQLALWFIGQLKDMLLQANHTDELWEQFFRLPFLEVIFAGFASLVCQCTELHICINSFQRDVNKLFLFLKTSRFSNTEELYLHHRGAWDEILRKHLGQIKSDAVMATIVAVTDTDLDISILCNVLEAKFGLDKKEVLGQQVSDIGIGLHTTTIFCIPPGFYNSDGYRDLVLGFLRDPLRAGKYLLDGEKMAIISMILLETLTRPELLAILHEINVFPTLHALHKTIRQAGPFEDLIALINIPEIKFPPHDSLGSGWHGLSGEICERTVQVFGKYLERVCGSVPLGFRITFEGNYWPRTFYYNADRGQDQVSHYYGLDDYFNLDDEWAVDPIVN